MSRKKSLTNEQAVEMRRTYATWVRNGEKTSYLVLSKMFGCGESTARDVIKWITYPDAGGENCTDKFDVAFETRTKILDWLHKNQNSTNQQITAALGFKKDHVYRSTCRMVELKEIERHGKGHGATFVAIVANTTPASTLRSLALNNQKQSLAENNAFGSRLKPAKEPWRYVHIVGDSPPIKNQGGQGRCAPRCCSTMGTDTFCL